MKRIKQPYYSKLSKQCQTLQSMYAMKTITTTTNPLYKPRLSWVACYWTQVRKFRLVHDWNRPFRWKLLYPVPLFCILLTRTITKREVVWFGAVQPKCTLPLATWNVRTFKPLNCSALVLPYMARQRARTPSPYSLCIDANFFSMRRGEGPSVHRLPP